MPNETSRRYLFVAIDRATRWVFLHTCANMTDRFNGRISELVKQTYFANAAELETTLQYYLKLYHHHIPQRAIGSKTPIESLKHWQGLRPELFVKRVYDQAGLDTYTMLPAKIRYRRATLSLF